MKVLFYTVREHVLTEEILDAIGARFEIFPTKFLIHVAQQAGLSPT